MRGNEEEEEREDKEGERTNQSVIPETSQSRDKRQMIEPQMECYKKKCSEMRRRKEIVSCFEKRKLVAWQIQLEREDDLHCRTVLDQFHPPSSFETVWIKK